MLSQNIGSRLCSSIFQQPFQKMTETWMAVIIARDLQARGVRPSFANRPLSDAAYNPATGTKTL